MKFSSATSCGFRKVSRRMSDSPCGGRLIARGISQELPHIWDWPSVILYVPLPICCSLKWIKFLFHTVPLFRSKGAWWLKHSRCTSSRKTFRQQSSYHGIILSNCRLINSAKPAFNCVLLFACSIETFISFEMLIQGSQHYGCFGIGSIFLINIVLEQRHTWPMYVI